MASTPAKKTTTKTKSNKANAPKQATPKPRASRRRAPTHQAIAKRAYELSLEDRSGDSVAHWLEAERELTGS